MKISLTKPLLLFFLFINTSYLSFSQSDQQEYAQSKENIKFDFDYIFSLDAAKKYSKEHPTWLAHVNTIPMSDTSRRYRDIIRAPYMTTFHWYDIKRDLNFLGRIVDTNTVYVYGVKSISFNAEDFQKAQIDSSIRDITQRYENGEPFDSLSAKYNHKHNGKFDYVKAGDLVPALDKRSQNIEVGEIFSAYDPKYNYYYVILKTIALRPEKFIKVLVTHYKDY